MTLNGYVDEFAVFPMLFSCVNLRNNVDIGLHYDNNPFWISTNTNKDDLE